MYRTLVLLHIITSIIFVLVAVTLTTKSIVGYRRNLSYTNTDRYLSIVFISLLYLTLINGGIMYFFVNPLLKSSTDIQVVLKRASMQFWVVEHFYVMTFALILSQIGGILVRKTTINRNRFGYASFYYGLTTLITMVSMVFYLVYR
jgi:hypothetical protein